VTVTRLRRRLRLLAWTLFSLFLTAMGTALYYLLPPTTRWTRDDDTRTLIVEGDVLATCTLRENRTCGPVQIWDVATGHEAARFLDGVPAFLATGTSKDCGRFVAVIPGEHAELRRIVTIDLKERTARHVDAPLGDFDSALFSAACDFVAVRRIRFAEATYVIADTTTGRVITRFVMPVGNLQDRASEYWWAAPDNGLFCDDGRFFVVNRLDAEGCAVRILDMRTGKATVIEDARLRAITPDSRALIADRSDDGTWIWDLEAMDWRRARLESAAPDTLGFSPDGRWMVSAPHEETKPVAIRFFDLRTGRLHWEFQTLTANRDVRDGDLQIDPGLGPLCTAGIGGLRQEMSFSPDGRLFVFRTQPSPGQWRTALYDVERKSLRHESITPDGSAISSYFTRDSRVLINAGPTDIELVDVEAGIPRLRIDLPDSLHGEAFLSPDGRTLYALRYPSPAEPTAWRDFLDEYLPWLHFGRTREGFMAVHAFDVDTGRELWALPSVSEDTVFGGSPEGVVTVNHLHDRNANGGAPWPIATTMCCWDVPPRRRWNWIVGVPLCAGLVLASIQLVRTVRRPVTKPQGAPPCS
jgi:hypothetical protein